MSYNPAEYISGLIEEVSNQDYQVVVNIPYSCRILSTTTQSSTGTCTAEFAINSTPLGGSTNAVSTSEVTEAHSTANVVSVGDNIVISISANSSCLNMSFTIYCLRT